MWARSCSLNLRFLALHGYNSRSWLDGDGMDEKAFSYVELVACKGHIAATTVYGSLIAKGMLACAPTRGCSNDQPKFTDDLDSIGQPMAKDDAHISKELIDSARHYFELVAEAGDGPALEWLSQDLSSRERTPKSACD